MKEKLTELMQEFESLIQIDGNHSAILQGTRGIVEYADDFIKVAFKKFQMQFYGENLSIVCLTQDSIEIQGIIKRIEYIWIIKIT